MLDFEIKVISTQDKEYAEQCYEIAKENDVSNGGNIDEADLLRKMAKYIVCAVKDDEVLGYVGMGQNFVRNVNSFIVQFAVKKEYRRQGIGSALIDYVKHHSKETRTLIIKPQKKQAESDVFFEKMGFNRFIKFGIIYYRFYTKYIENNQYLKYTEEENELQ